MFQDIAHTIELAGVDIPALKEDISSCFDPFRIFGIRLDKDRIQGVCLDTGDKITFEFFDEVLYLFEPLEQDDRVSKRFVATLQEWVGDRGGLVKVEPNKTKLQVEYTKIEDGFIWQLSSGDRPS